MSLFVDVDFCIDIEDFDGDDDLRGDFPCPFCSEDFDLVGLCYHIDEEHTSEARSGVCVFDSFVYLALFNYYGY